MSISITISGTTYTLPTQGENPPWGEDLSDLIEAMAASLNSITGDDDILLSNFSIPSVQAVATDVTNLIFDTATVRGAIIDYSLYRISNSQELSETGTMYVSYANGAASPKWSLAQYYTGNSNVTFSITDAGQIQYTATTLTGTYTSGVMKFKARTLPQ